MMKKSMHRGISLLVMVLMLFAMLPAGAMAAESEPAVSLEQAIQKVKQNFTIPAEYTEFTSGFRSRENKQIWSLNWADKENREGSLNAEVDAATGVIISMHIYKMGRQTTEIPQVSLEQAQKLGLDLLQRLIPDRVANLQYVPNQQVIPLSSWEGGQYELRWQRMANQVPVGDEGVTLRISSSNGTINSYGLNWSDKTIPAKQQLITTEEAAAAFASNEMLELQYLVIPEYSPLRTAEKKQPRLVYRLNHSSHGIIDAVSGKPIENQEWFGINEIGGMGSADKQMANSPSPLTPQEQEEIDRTLNLISQEKAASIMRQWVTLPANVQLQEANLYKDYQDPQSRIWNLSWSADPAAKTWSYVNAQVDAVSGEIKSFYIDRAEYNEEKPTLDRAAAEKIARDFLARIQPQKQKSVRLQPDPYQEVYTKEAVYPNQWQFQFIRMENEIPCPAHGIRIAVDSRSKQIAAYSLNWPSLEFPDPGKVMGMDQANVKYLQNQPLTLQYKLIYPQINVRSEALGEYKLVYSPRAEVTARQSDIIDANTGELLNWDGTPVADSLQPRAFTDIAGHFAEKEISMLGQAGIMTEYGNTFRPQEQISLVTMLRVMIMAQNGYYNLNQMSDEEIIDQAVRNKWLKEKMQTDTVMTTGLLAQMMVRMLDIEYVAQMPSPALQAPYRDFKSLNEDLKGCAALCWGLGIIKGDGVNFNASHQTTRGEAAAVLVRTLNTAGQKNNPY
ncbi:MAG: hypothetical protein GXY49_02455 [Syntrophomonadaceae bacterium]|nr:hypothetical protein [Syntrophomonadaceae bacterium]